MHEIKRNNFRHITHIKPWKLLISCNIDRDLNWTKSVLEISIEYFQLRAPYESSKLIIALPEHVFGEKKTKRGEKRRNNQEFSIFMKLIDWQKAFDSGNCIFLGYTRCNWKSNKNRFSLVCLPNPLISDRITPLLINQSEVKITAILFSAT